MADELLDRRKRSKLVVRSLGSRYYRDKAEEARTIWAEAHDPSVQASMEAIARTYDRLADLAERTEGVRKPH